MLVVTRPKSSASASAAAASASASAFRLSMAEGGEEGGAAPEGATFELEHAIGYSGHVASSLVAHPNGQDLIYAAGGCIVSCDKDDPHKQTFFRGHDDDITCLAVSRSGRYIASGQAGANADVIVWDFEEKAVLFRCDREGCCARFPQHGIAA